MELSLNIRALTENVSLERACELASGAGFGAFDYFVELDEASSALHAENRREVAEQRRRIIERAGMRCNQTHAPFRFPLKKWEGNECFELVVRSLEISAILGADICIVHPLHHMEYRGHAEEIFRLNMDYYRSLIPYCREYGIKVAVENMWQKHRIRKTITHDTCSAPEEFIRYIDTLDSEYIVACLDLGHVVLPDNSVEPDEFIRLLGRDRLKALHVHDNDYTADQHLIPYRGKIDFDAITSALADIDYTGDFTYELASSEFALPEPLLPYAVGYSAEVGRHLMGEIDRKRK